MAKSISVLPLQVRISRKNTTKRILTISILFLFLFLLSYRLRELKNHGVVWLFAFLCELWFALLWVIALTINWSPVEYKIYTQHLLKRFQDLPPLDIFVTTADPILEPPMMTLNTVLSVLSLDYPTKKLACYVSDDAASPIIYYSLAEAVKFARLWIPYCKKYNVQVRAPFQYFSGDESNASSCHPSPEFPKEWKCLKNEYEMLSKKIEAVRNSNYDPACSFGTFSTIERGSHPSIVKVIWENKDGAEDEVPNLIYVAREKRPTYPHHFKAGAMNALTRVSGVMTNSPFVLNIDCDMFVNNPKIALHAMCLHLDIEKERECAFVVCPQLFYGGIKDDPFGNHMVVWQQNLARGITGIQGPFYNGSGCFHRRKAIYGLSPDEAESGSEDSSTCSGMINEDMLKERFGDSEEFVSSAAQLMLEKNEISDSCSSLRITLTSASQVANCNYESNTEWGTQVGWLYGSATEDVLTGQRIHAAGWLTRYCTPDPDPFLGCAPSTGPIINIQQKRWATGLLEVLFSRRNPIFDIFSGGLWFRQFLVYISVYLWGLQSIPELCYAILPACSLLNNTSSMPKVSEPAALIAASLFILYTIHGVSEYIQCGLSIRNWWNNRRMEMISASSGRLFAVFTIILKLCGLSETTFEVTPKDQNLPDSEHGEVDPGRFTFDDSLMNVPGTVVVMVHIVALVVGVVRMVWLNDHCGAGLVELLWSAWVVVSFLPYVKGLYRKGKYGIPSSVISKSVVLAGVFIYTRVAARPLDASVPDGSKDYKIHG